MSNLESAMLRDYINLRNEITSVWVFSTPAVLQALQNYFRPQLKSPRLMSHLTKVSDLVETLEAKQILTPNQVEPFLIIASHSQTPTTTKGLVETYQLKYDLLTPPVPTSEDQKSEIIPDLTVNNPKRIQQVNQTSESTNVPRKLSLEIRNKALREVAADWRFLARICGLSEEFIRFRNKKDIPKYLEEVFAHFERTCQASNLDEVMVKFIHVCKSC